MKNGFKNLRHDLIEVNGFLSVYRPKFRRSRNAGPKTMILGLSHVNSLILSRMISLVLSLTRVCQRKKAARAQTPKFLTNK